MLLMFNPFEQFQVFLHAIISKKFMVYIRHIIYLTESILINCFVIVLFMSFFAQLSNMKLRFVQGFLFLVLAFLYIFIFDLVNTYLPNEGQKYFPFFLYLFIFICIHNLIGILPFAFTTTSHLSVTFTLSFMVWGGCLIISFQENGERFFSVFFPSGIPFMLLPFLIAIELISFVFRSVSLALRLFANIVAGHILLDTLALYVYNKIYPSITTIIDFILAILSFIVSSVLVLFELVVAFLQGYIFVVLSIIYLKDAYTAQNH